MQSFRGRDQARASCITSLAVVLLASISACGSSSDTTRPAGSIAGSYVATGFTVTPTGESAINVLTAGGSLDITIAADSSTTGTLDVPASVTGSTEFVEDMTGSATVTTSTVQFQQTADTFVRDLSWTRNGTSLTVVNQTAGSAAFTITLTRQ
jgi:hypothetical protein